MVSRVIKVIILIACIVAGIVAILLAPIIQLNYKGTQTVDYTPAVEQINLIVDSEISNIYLNYDTNENSDLINMTYIFSIGHPLIVSPPSISINFENSTFGNILTIDLKIRFPKGFYSNWITKTYLTINPNLLSNLSISTATGNIELDNTYSLNKTFIDLKLTSGTGNIDVDLVNETNIWGNLHLIRSTGNCYLDIAENSNLGGTFQVNSSTGNSIITLLENVTLNNDFSIKTSTGNINLDLFNISLNNNEIQGLLESSTGNIRTTIRQRLDPSGNLTLIYAGGTGNANLDIKLEKNYISSEISSQTTTGTIHYEPHPGYNIISNKLISTEVGLSSNFDADISTSTGNINIKAERS